MLLDIGIGILSAIFIHHLFGVGGPVLVGAGILFSLLPDIDFLFAVQKRYTALAHEHRLLLHYPIPYVLFGMTVISFFDLPYALLFGITTLLHFVHDSIGIGWGIQWLYPFSKNHYAFFYHYDTSRNGLPQKAVYSWSPEEVRSLSRQYGDKDWIRNIYLRCHPYAIVELLVFLAAVCALFFAR